MSTTSEPTTLHEATGPPLAPLPSTSHLLRPVIARAEREPDRPVAAVRHGDRFVDVTAADLLAGVRRLAKGLVASGIEPGDRVVIMSHTRLEWLVLDYAILAAGAVTVPIYETSSAEQTGWILADSGARLAVLETPAMGSLYERVHEDASACREALVIDEGGLDELERRGRSVEDATLDARIGALTTDRVATIVYTSGTTGRPKGCVQTQGNLCANVAQNIEAMRSTLREDETSLLFLPLAHTLAKAIALVCMEWGAKVAFATDMSHVAEELAMARPTLVVSVPRVFEKVFNNAQHKANAEGHGKVFARAEEVAIRWSLDRHAGHRHPLTAIEHAVMDGLVYRKVRAAFGGRLRFAVSGGGPLGDRLTHFFDGVGVRTYEGYGLTETSPTLTLNSGDGWKPGTVGRPLAGTTIRIAADGEVLAKGPQVFRGYRNDDAATAGTFDDEGWFLTGDIGELDAEGYLRITGRKKELIVTAAGKNVAPAPLEDRLRSHPLVSQAIVVGDQRPFIGAILALDDEALAEWATERGLDGVERSVLLGHAEVLAELQAAVDEANAAVSRGPSRYGPSRCFPTT